MEPPSAPNPQFLTRSGDAFPTKVIESLGGAGVQGSQLYPFLGPAEEPDELGRLANYRVLGLLGYGGMGMVFRAEDTTLRRPVALKVMKPELERGKGAAWQRFLREARAMAAINHEHIITVYQVGQEGDLIFLAMELLEGETLEAWCQRVGRPCAADIVRIGRQTALGLHAIHQRGVIHRDIKPSNLFIEVKDEGGTRKDEGGSRKDEKSQTTGASFRLPPCSYRVKILDFGLALDTQENTHLTQSGTILGTPAYLSPEQARGKATDVRTDLFSLGAVLYRLCTGSVPFPAANTLDQLAALAADEPAPIEHANPAIPAEVAELVMQLLSKKPDDRPASAAELAQRLHQIEQQLSSTGLLAAPDATELLPVAPPRRRRPSGPPAAWRRHWKWLVAAPIAGAVLVLAVLGGLSLLDRPDPPAPTFLSDLPKVHTVNWPFHKIDKEKGKGKGLPAEIFEPITVAGQLSPHGIFMHPAPPHDQPASITYHLGRQYRTFSTRVALNDSGPEAQCAMTFAVYGDGKMLWKSKAIDRQDQAETCGLDIRGVSLLKLEVTADGDVRRAHAVWLEPAVAK